MRGKFKKCPFCGSKAEIRDVYDVVDWTEDDEPVTKRRFVCECKGDECWVNPVTDAFDTEEEAIEAWNRRSEGAIKALKQEPCVDVVSRNAIIQTLNNMDRYVANELILCDTNNKFPQNEVFIVDDVFEQIAEQLPSVTPKQQTCEDCISRQAAIDCLNADFTIDGKENMETVVDYINGAFKQIKALPSITPHPKVGQWIYDKTIENWRCSECNETPKTMGYVGTADFMAEHFKFCNHCGAKMERSDK